GDHFRPARLQCVAARKPGSAEPEHCDRLACERSDGDHDSARHSRASENIQGAHRSFSVERPASASITEMIQNRITICGSVQPSCSKWWGIGALRNTRFPVRLKEPTCTIPR